MSGVKLLTEEVEQEVTFLESVDPKFVSLVKHGANRMPFRVIKSEKGGEQVDNLVIQSLLVPKGVEIGDVVAQEGCEFLNDLDTSKKKEFEEFVKYEQLPESDFVDESFKMSKIGESFAIVGELKDKEKTEGVISISKADSEKLGNIPASPMDATLDVVQAAVLPSFRDLFERELNSMLDVVYGSLKQTSVEPAQRSETIIGAVDGFKRFLTVGLAAIGGGEVKFDKKIGEKGGETEMLQFESKEEFQKEVSGIVKPILTDFGTELLKKLKADEEEDTERSNSEEEEKETKETSEENKTKTTEASEEKEKDGENEKEESKTSLDSIAETVKSLIEKVDAISNLTEGERGSDDVHKEDMDEDTGKEDTDSKGKKSVFKGMLVDYDHVRKIGRSRR